MSEQPVAIITGSGRGIGRAIAHGLSKQGYRLALVSRTLGHLQQVCAEVGQGLALSADIRRPEQVEEVIRQTLDEYGRIDAVVNAAGYLKVAALSTMDLEAWHATLETNLSGTFYLCRAVWPHLVARGGGVIVNISSPSAQDPFAGLGAYGAAKAGVETLGLVLGREGSELGIAVHTISPGATETEMFRQIMSPQQAPSEQLLTPGEVASVAVHCVIGTLRHTSGTVIHVKKHP